MTGSSTRMKVKASPIRGIVFDFDGTLAELHLDFQLMKQGVAGLANAFLATPVSPGTATALEWIETLSESLTAVDPDSVPEFRSRCQLMITDMEIKAARKGKLFHFSLDVLMGLRARGVKLGVITRNCTAAVKTVFPEIDEFVEVLLAREDVPLTKPHPDHLLRALDALSLKPGDCLMVGDHRIDLQTARQAGTRSGAVCTGNMAEAELRCEEPDFLAEDVQILLKDLQDRELLWNGK